jgi:hypothetical protein
MSRLLHNGAPPEGADVTASGVLLLPRQEGRKYVAIVNTSNNVPIYLALNDSPDGTTNQAEVGKGIYISPDGGSYEITEDNLYKGEIWAIHGGPGTVPVTIQRGS